MPQENATDQAHAQVPTTTEAPERSKRGRSEVLDCVRQFEQRRAEGVSQRQAAQDLGVPRTSLQRWAARKRGIAAHPEVIAFFESPVGAAFLHQLVTAAHIVFSFIGSCGSRLIGRFLQESGLAPFLATSKGSQHKFAAQVEAAIADYGDEQSRALAATMAPKVITVCQDETFHPKPCLVAIEPVSNFIVLERYDDKRDAATWNKRMSEALDSLPVQVKQSTSDEAKGIISHVQQGLGAHHSPDLFHVQHTLGGALARPLSQKVRETDKALQAAQADLEVVTVQCAQWEAKPRPQGRPPDLAGRRRLAEARVEGAKKNNEIAQQKQEQGRQAIRGLSESYHPFDLATGQLRALPAIEKDLLGHLASARALVAEGYLPARVTAGIDKAARVLPGMVATLTFFFNEAAATIAALGLDAVACQQAIEGLLPGIYIAIAAKKAKTSKQRRRLAALAETLQRRAFAAAPRLRDVAVTEALLACSHMFQRASSCVEGRNGQLSLRHHCLHSISENRLKALTTVHNYAIEDADKTTAAERFFGSKPTRSLFEHVRERVMPLGRPAAKRPRPKPTLIAA